MIDWAWLTNPRRVDQLVDLAQQHVAFVAIAVLGGFAIAAPLAVLAVRRRWLYAPLLGITGVLFTIPSLAMFLLIGALYGRLLAFSTAATGLAIYSLLILFRNTVAGLDAVPADVKEASAALGYTPNQQLWRIELPIALPVIIAGLRVATVTTVGLVTITALTGWGGFGDLIYTGFRRQNLTILLTGMVLCVTLSVIFDLALVALQRWLSPWARKGATA